MFLVMLMFARATAQCAVLVLVVRVASIVHVIASTVSVVCYADSV